MTIITMMKRYFDYVWDAVKSRRRQKANSIERIKLGAGRGINVRGTNISATTWCNACAKV
jgi:hypothetical protein